jgi:hypothetical protein
MTTHVVNSTRFKPGHAPHNKGIETEKKLKKLELFRENRAIYCKNHGLHTSWRMHSDNNVQCKICSSQWAKKRREKKPIHYLLLDAKQHAKSKGISFNLTEADILYLLSKQANKCNLSGIKFDQDNKMSLDKIDPNGCYVLENVQLVIFDVNRMKTDLEQSRFLKLCHLISEFSY